MSRRPTYCCGACPPTERGGFDCTCRGNPRCPKNRPNPSAYGTGKMLGLLIGILIIKTLGRAWK